MPLFLAIVPQTLCVILALYSVLMKDYPMAAFLGLCAIVVALSLILMILMRIKQEVTKK